MDDLNCEGTVVAQTLRELDVINTKLGGNDISIDGLNRLLEHKNGEAFKVADLGCGGGDILKLFKQWGTRKNKHLELVGIDANPFIIDYARKNLRGMQNISFKTQNVLTREFARQQFDIIHCSLFLHHFNEEELLHLFRSFKNQARIGVIINDLHRHWLAYYSIKVLTQLFSKSAMVKFDAPLSVRRAFKKEELRSLLKQAGFADVQIKWRWAFRWQVVLINE